MMRADQSLGKERNNQYMNKPKNNLMQLHERLNIILNYLVRHSKLLTF